MDATWQANEGWRCLKIANSEGLGRQLLPTSNSKHEVKPPVNGKFSWVIHTKFPQWKGQKRCLLEAVAQAPLRHLTWVAIQKCEIYRLLKLALFTTVQSGDSRHGHREWMQLDLTSRESKWRGRDLRLVNLRHRL